MGRVAMLGLILLAGLSCTRKVSQEGGLELMLMSDLPTTDLTRVHLEISQESAPGEWHKVFDREQLVPGEVSLPTTASIEAGHSPNQGALIVFTGQKESVENGQRVVRTLVQRIVQTQVPTDRVAELKMLLTVTCVDMVTACNVGESCQPNSGTCGPNKVDSSSLPTYGTADESPGTDLTSGFPPGAGGGPTGTAGASLGKAGAGGSPNGPPGAGGSPGSAGAGHATGCAGPAPFRITSDVLSDFEATPSDLVRDVSQPGHWFSYDRNPEYHNLYSSVFTPDPGDWTVESPGHGGTGNAVHTTGRLNMVHVPAPHWEAGVGLSLATSGNNEATPIGVSEYAGISFYAKSSLGSAISVQFATVNTGSYCYCVASNNCTEDTLVITNVAPDWTQYTVRFADLLQPANFPFDSRGLVTIKFASNGSIPYFDFWIDDVRLIH